MAARRRAVADFAGVATETRLPAANPRFHFRRERRVSAFLQRRFPAARDVAQGARSNRNVGLNDERLLLCDVDVAGRAAFLMAAARASAFVLKSQHLARRQKHARKRDFHRRGFDARRRHRASRRLTLPRGRRRDSRGFAVASGAIIGDRTRRLPSLLRTGMTDEARPVSFAPVGNLPECTDAGQHVVRPISAGEETLFALVRFVVRRMTRSAVFLCLCLCAIRIE